MGNSARWLCYCSAIPQILIEFLPMQPSKEFTILVVCTGNICRSPVAEAMLVKKLGASPGLRISSAGLAAPIGIKPDPLAVKAANALGYEVSPDKRSQQVLLSQMQAADMIFVMDSGHKGLVSARMPALDCSISRQILTWREINTGSPQANASATAMPKFSWWEDRMKASAQRKAPHFRSPRNMPVQVM